jgi:ribA/ribD-fused uncharacterized protein
MNIITAFTGFYRILSNFYPAPVTYGGIRFPTTEHAYQAAKTWDDELRRGIADLRNPATAKRIGRIIPLREDWEAVKIDVMRDVLALKFQPAGSIWQLAPFDEGLRAGRR